MKYIVNFIFLLLLSCNEIVEQTKHYSFGLLNFDVKNVESRIVKRTGIDSKIGYVILNQKDTLYIEYGRPGIFRLREGIPTVLPLNEKENVEDLIGRELDENPFEFWVDENEVGYDTDYGVFLKNFYYYDTINSIVVKIVQPKKVGSGMTGVYIPKLKDGNGFSMYGKNLDSLTQHKVLSIIQSINYR